MNLQQDTLGGLLERPLVTIGSGARASQALRLAWSQQIHHLPVVDGSTVLGVVCTCDLAEAPPDSRVDDWMSQPPVMLDAAASATDAAVTMNERGIGSVIVTFDDAAFGIVTRGDLLSVRPELEPSRAKAHGECGGLTRHLRRDGAAGCTHCIHCQTPVGAAGRQNSPS